MTEAVTRMEAVWRQRASRLSQRAAVNGLSAGSGALPVMVLRLGNERYGIGLPDVAEVLPPVQITPVPGVAAVFAGVINAHGEIRPVISLRRLLGIEALPGSDPARVVLLRKDGREMGLEIDGVEQIRWVGPLDFPSEGRGAGLSQCVARSTYVIRSTSDLLMLLNTEALFAELRTGDAT
jgi:purine-binding chemotaxis protein CheW